jgi:hypothetical protein
MVPRTWGTTRQFRSKIHPLNEHTKKVSATSVSAEKFKKMLIHGRYYTTNINSVKEVKYAF